MRRFKFPDIEPKNYSLQLFITGAFMFQGVFHSANLWSRKLLYSMPTFVAYQISYVMMPVILTLSLIRVMRRKKTAFETFAVNAIQYLALNIIICMLYLFKDHGYAAIELASVLTGHSLGLIISLILITVASRYSTPKKWR